MGRWDRGGWGGGWGFREYVPVAQKRSRAVQLAAAVAKKEKRAPCPVQVAGRAIAKTFWGKAWCENLDRYGDFANRLPRGRTYLRNGSVVDLVVSRGKIAAIVAGSEPYTVGIDIEPLAAKTWATLRRDCSASIDSLLDLLAGRFSDGVMQRLVRTDDGLFPQPKQIRMKCSCPDWATVCKHVAAVLYGVGARLDADPQLLFLLRGVDHAQLVGEAVSRENLDRSLAAAPGSLAETDLSALFGIDLDPGNGPTDGAAASPSMSSSKPSSSKSSSSKSRTTRGRSRSKPDDVRVDTPEPAPPARRSRSASSQPTGMDIAISAAKRTAAANKRPAAVPKVNDAAEASQAKTAAMIAKVKAAAAAANVGSAATTKKTKVKSIVAATPATAPGPSAGANAEDARVTRTPRSASRRRIDPSPTVPAASAPDRSPFAATTPAAATAKVPAKSKTAATSTAAAKSKIAARAESTAKNGATTTGRSTSARKVSTTGTVAGEPARKEAARRSSTKFDEVPLDANFANAAQKAPGPEESSAVQLAQSPAATSSRKSKRGSGRPKSG